MKHPTEVFDEWAIIGKDKGMEASHSASVSEILDFAISQIEKNSTEFKFLDFREITSTSSGIVVLLQ